MGYMRTRNNATWIEIETTRDFSRVFGIIKKYKFLIIGSFDKLEGEDYDNFIELWKGNITNYKIRVTTNLLAIQEGWQQHPNSFKIEVPDENSIVLVHMTGSTHYTGPMDIPSILAFVKECEDNFEEKSKKEKTKKGI